MLNGWTEVNPFTVTGISGGIQNSASHIHITAPSAVIAAGLFSRGISSHSSTDVTLA